MLRPTTPAQAALKGELVTVFQRCAHCLSSEEIRVVVDEVLEHLHRPSGLGLEEDYQAEIGPRRLFSRHGAQGHTVAVESFDRDDFMALKAQVVEQSAIMLPLPGGLALNTEVAFCAVLSIVHHEVWYKGRVVFSSPTGTALQLRALTESHEVLWATAERAFDRGHLVLKLPSSGPKTSPPEDPNRTIPPGARSGCRSRAASARPTASRRPDAPRPSRPVRLSAGPVSRGRVVQLDASASSLGRAAQPRTGPPSGGHRQDKVPKIVQSYLERLHCCDYFELLGLHWSAYSECVEEAYRKALDELYIPNMAQAHNKHVQRILNALTKAYRVLIDPDTRSAYRHRVVSDDRLDGAVDIYLKKAGMARMRKEHREARDNFRRAHEIDPHHHHVVDQKPVFGEF